LKNHFVANISGIAIASFTTTTTTRCVTVSSSGVAATKLDVSSKALAHFATRFHALGVRKGTTINKYIIGRNIPNAGKASPAELSADPHAVAIGLLVDSEHPVVGSVRQPRHPARFDGTPAELGVPAPALGQHTDEILTELGRADDIARLRESGVVA
jgi:crotonobetainyl-CoA:carnitine CoA-transferase CaiB-like acyl-CoA transferase